MGRRAIERRGRRGRACLEGGCVLSPSPPAAAGGYFPLRAGAEGLCASGRRRHHTTAFRNCPPPAPRSRRPPPPLFRPRAMPAAWPLCPLFPSAYGGILCGGPARYSTVSLSLLARAPDSSVRCCPTPLVCCCPPVPPTTGGGGGAAWGRRSPQAGSNSGSSGGPRPPYTREGVARCLPPRLGVRSVAPCDSPCPHCSARTCARPRLPRHSPSSTGTLGGGARAEALRGGVSEFEPGPVAEPAAGYCSSLF